MLGAAAIGGVLWIARQTVGVLVGGGLFGVALYLLLRAFDGSKRVAFAVGAGRLEVRGDVFAETIALADPDLERALRVGGGDPLRRGSWAVRAASARPGRAECRCDATAIGNAYSRKRNKVFQGDAGNWLDGGVLPVAVPAKFPALSLSGLVAGVVSHAAGNKTPGRPCSDPVARHRRVPGSGRDVGAAGPTL
ncbi:MAG: hypothetical protein B9S34_16520 [Opitutia bacterium Tous-C1TDCM]|nr:MAG: hypothetical protein B9S34_16520 [Opitutae bacterium Tous-C1TDCM]